MEALELGMAHRHGLGVAVAGPRMRLAERLGLGPALEVGIAAPHGVGGIEDVILLLRAAQEMKRHEAGKLVQVAFTAEPHVLEILRAVLQDLEAVHSDVNAGLLSTDRSHGGRKSIDCSGRRHAVRYSLP